MNDKQILTVLSLILVVMTVGFFGSGFLTGLLSYQYSNTTMNLTVSGFVAINASQAIIDGIQFGALDPAPTTNKTAVNDSTGAPAVNCTDYNITIDSSSNVNVDLFNDAADDLLKQGGGGYINITNVTLSANQTQCGNNVNITYTQAMGGLVRLNKTYYIIGNNSPTSTGPCKAVAPTYNCYIAYWITVPTVSTGIYNTTYEFCGAQQDTGVGSCS